jgi:acyl-CoA synthetase (AMP-forming)/AMP-acid ligase II
MGMLGALLSPLVWSQPVHMIDVWDPERILAAMLEAGLTCGSGSPYFLNSLVEHPAFTDEHRALIRYVAMGGASIPAAVAERVDAMGISLVRGYGSTEHPSCTGSAHGDPATRRLHTDGRALPGNDVRVVDDDGRPLGPGEAGEVQSRGPELFVGYTDPALTATAFDPDGWFCTGDIGVIDEDGYLTITDRKKDIIIRGGEKVSAAEVEEVLARMAGVVEVAVVPAPDARLGEHGCAFVRPGPDGAPPPDLEGLRRHLAAAGLARQKWPEELRVVDDFPRTPSGKIKKFVLRDELREEARQ